MERTKNQVDDCYFCLVNVKRFNKKNKQHLQYSNVHSAIRSIPHSDKVPVPIFTKLPDIDEDQHRSSTSSTNSDDDDEEQDIAHEAWNAVRVFLYSQSELNDLIQDLNFSKQSAEVLASRLQEKHLLKAGISVSFYRDREEKLRKSFQSDCQLVYCTDVEGLLLAMGFSAHRSNDWRFLLIAQKEALSVSCFIMVTSMNPSL